MATRIWLESKDMSERGSSTRFGYGAAVVALGVACACGIAGASARENPLSASSNAAPSQPGAEVDAVSKSDGLVGSWIVTSVTSSQSHTRMVPLSGSPVVRFGPGRLVDAWCSLAPYREAGTRIEFDEPFVVSSAIRPGCKQMWSAAASRFIFRKLFSGSLAWHLSGGSLVLERAGVGSMNLVPAA